jgi:hypothetical protein
MGLYAPVTGELIISMNDDVEYIDVGRASCLDNGRIQYFCKL